MSRLQEQLRIIREREEAHRILGASRCTVLFPDETIASRVSWSELAALARNGLEQLIKFDQRFASFLDSDLFHHRYVIEGATALPALDRGQESAAANAEIQQLIQHFCYLLVPYFTTRPGQKCVEWLLRAHSAGALDPASLVVAALPYIGTEAFERLVAALHLAQHGVAKVRWHWLERVHSLDHLVEQSSELNWFVPFLLDTAEALVRARVSAEGWHRLLLCYGSTLVAKHPLRAGSVIRLVTLSLSRVGQAAERDKHLWQAFWYAALGMLVAAYRAVGAAVRSDVFSATVRALLRLYVRTRTWYSGDPAWCRRLTLVLANLYAGSPHQPFPHECLETLSSCTDEWYRVLGALDASETESLRTAYSLALLEYSWHQQDADDDCWHQLVARLPPSPSGCSALIGRLLELFDATVASESADATKVHSAADAQMMRSQRMMDASTETRASLSADHANANLETPGSPCSATEMQAPAEWHETTSHGPEVLLSKVSCKRGGRTTTHPPSDSDADRERFRSAAPTTETASSTLAATPSGSLDAKHRAQPAGMLPRTRAPSASALTRATVEPGDASAADAASGARVVSAGIGAEAPPVDTSTAPHSLRRRQVPSEFAALDRSQRILRPLVAHVDPVTFWEALYAHERRFRGRARSWTLLCERCIAASSPLRSLQHPDPRVRTRTLHGLSQAPSAVQEQALPIILELLQQPNGFEDDVQRALCAPDDATCGDVLWLRDQLVRVGAPALESLLPRAMLLYLRAVGACPVRALVRCYRLASRYRHGMSASPKEADEIHSHGLAEGVIVWEAAFEQLCAHWRLAPETNAERAARRAEPAEIWFRRLGERFGRSRGAEAFTALLEQLVDLTMNEDENGVTACTLLLEWLRTGADLLDEVTIWRFLASIVHRLAAVHWLTPVSRILHTLNDRLAQTKPITDPMLVMPHVQRILEAIASVLARAPHPSAITVLAETFIWLATQSSPMECEAVCYALQLDTYREQVLEFLANAGVQAARWLAVGAIEPVDVPAALALLDTCSANLGVAGTTALLEHLFRACATDATWSAQLRQQTRRLLHQIVHEHPENDHREHLLDRHTAQLVATCIRLLKPLDDSDWCVVEPLWALSKASTGLAVIRALLDALQERATDASTPQAPLSRPLITALIAACRWLATGPTEQPAFTLVVPRSWLVDLLQSSAFHADNQKSLWLLEAIDLGRLDWKPEPPAAPNEHVSTTPTTATRSDSDPWMRFIQEQFDLACSGTLDTNRLSCVLCVALRDGTARAALQARHVAALLNANKASTCTHVPQGDHQRWRRHAARLLIQCLHDAGTRGSGLHGELLEALLGALCQHHEWLPASERPAYRVTVVRGLVCYAQSLRSGDAVHAMWNVVCLTASRDLPLDAVRDLFREVIGQDEAALEPVFRALRDARRIRAGTLAPVHAPGAARRGDATLSEHRSSLSSSSSSSSTTTTTTATSPVSATAMDRLWLQLLQDAAACAPRHVRRLLSEASGIAPAVLQRLPEYLDMGRVFGNDSTEDILSFLETRHLPVALVQHLVTQVWPLTRIREALEKRAQPVVVAILVEHLVRVARADVPRKQHHQRRELQETLRVLGRLLLEQNADPVLVRRWLEHPYTRTLGPGMLPLLAAHADPVCVACAVRTFGYKMVPHLPRVLAHWPAPPVVQALLETLPEFVSAPYIRQLWASMSESFPDDREAAAMRSLLVEAAPPMSILEALKAETQHLACLSGCKMMHTEPFQSLTEALSSWDSTLVQRSSEQILAVIWRGLESRERIMMKAFYAGCETEPSISEQLEQLETHCMEALVTMVLVLPHPACGEILYRSLLWCQSFAADEDSAGGDIASERPARPTKRQRSSSSSSSSTSSSSTIGSDPDEAAPLGRAHMRRASHWRRIVWFKLITKFASRLGSRFQEYVELVWDTIAEHAQLDAASAATPDPTPSEAAEVRVAALETLAVCLEAATPSCAQLSSSQCETCLDILAQWLSEAYMASPVAATALERLVAALARSGLSQRVTTVSTTSGTSSPLVRLGRLILVMPEVRRVPASSAAAALRLRVRLVRVLIETLDEAYLPPLLPRTLSWLAEVLDNPDSAVEEMARDIANRLSRISGEDILTQLRETPAI